MLLRQSTAALGDEPFDSDGATAQAPWAAAAAADGHRRTHRRLDKLAAMPVEGDEFLGFRLLRVLGEGAFGRVFLAEQLDLANRPVALKITADNESEPCQLARLRHTNIVPIHSWHRRGGLQALCMPYVGATTLADVLRHIRHDRKLPTSGRFIGSTLAEAALSTRRERPGSSQRLRTWRLDDSTGGGTAPEPTDRQVDEGPSAKSAGAATTRVEDRRPAASGDEGAASPFPQFGRSYVDAVLWIVARLAEGLAHAHDRGIHHRDLKPANVLIADDGQPILLDFSLADSCGDDSAARASVGGTLPYMAPEQLNVFRGAALPGQLDARADLYSLGVVFYELLASQPPFPQPAGESTDARLAQMVADRESIRPRLRTINRCVPAAVESIVTRLLEPSAICRYQSADELLADLKAQAEHRPLVHAPDWSPTERAAKFVRRHPRLTSWVTLAAATLTASLIGAGSYLVRDAEARRLEARAAVARFTPKARMAGALLGSRRNLPMVREGRLVAEAALAELGPLAEPRGPAVAGLLAGPEREAFERSLGELEFILAKAQAGGMASSAAAGDESAPWLARAERHLAAGGLPRYLLAEKFRLAAAANDQVGARRWRGLADALPATASDWLAEARDEEQQGQYLQAIETLGLAEQARPDDFACWYLKGQVSDSLGRHRDAVAAYRACLAIDPGFAWCYFNRGLAWAKLKQFGAARADFARFIELEPGRSEGWLQRSLAAQDMGLFDEALADLEAAKARGASRARVAFQRARLLSQKGDKAGSRQALDEGLAQRPMTEQDWVARGLARLATAPADALADFDAALAVNPRSFPALQNKAHVLSRHLKRTAESAAVLDQAVALYPDDFRPIAGRGVLHARLGDRAKAHADARQALAIDDAPINVYQVAGIYASTSRTVPDDRREALRLLGQALATGTGVDLLDTDPELAPLRGDAEYERLRRAALELRPGAATGG